jgi:hypothetical protein
MKRHWLALTIALAAAGWATGADAQRERNPEGEAVKNMIFQAFGSIMQQAQCDMLREQARKAGRQNDPCEPAQSGYHTQPPPPPELPPLPTPDRRNDWRR